MDLTSESRSIRSKRSSRSKRFEAFEQLEHFELCLLFGLLPGLQSVVLVALAVNRRARLRHLTLIAEMFCMWRQKQRGKASEMAAIARPSILP
jgi:hypothetical protein